MYDRDQLGVYLQDVSRVSDLITVEEERELGRRIQAGDIEARNKLVEANLRFAVAVAQEFLGSCGLDQDELVQLGNIGLIRAATKFDPDRGVKFTSYAVWWINQAILRDLRDRFRTVRVPSNVQKTVSHADREAEKLAQRLSREPTDDEVATEVGLELDRLRRVKRQVLPAWSLNKLRTNGNPIGFGESPSSQHREEIEYLVDESPTPDEEAEAHDTERQVAMALEQLSPRDADIIERRFGLNGHGGQTQTLQEVGSDIGLTRERVRQLEKRTLRTLRHRLSDFGPGVTPAP